MLGDTDVNKRDTAPAFLEFTFWLWEMDNKVNTQTRSFQTMLCARNKIKTGNGCRVISGGRGVGLL